MIIGNFGYGKFVFNCVLIYEFFIKFVLKMGFFFFDFIWVSVNDVGYFIDVVIYIKDFKKMLEW